MHVGNAPEKHIRIIYICIIYISPIFNNGSLKYKYDTIARSKK